MQNFKFGNLTDVGLVRKNNEDYYGCFDSQNGYVFVVCDGMGGHVGGAIASQTAVEAIREFYELSVYDNLIISIQNALSHANNAILQKIAESPELEGMGTTAVLLIVKDDKVYYGHIGDSRIYYYHNKNLFRITKDHSFVQAMVDSGNITEQEAENHPKKNQITKALGIQSFIEATVCNEPILPVENDYFLLCSDGLTGMVSDQNIKKNIGINKDLQGKVTELVELAKQNGGLDNITAQLIQFAKTSNLQSNFTVPFKQNNSAGKQLRKKNILMGIIGLSVLVLLYLGYSYYSSSATKDKNELKSDSTENEAKVNIAGIKKTELKMSDAEVEKEMKRYDQPLKQREISAPLISETAGNLEARNNINGKSSRILHITHTIQKGDDSGEMERKFKKPWSQMKAEDISYSDKNPVIGKKIKIEIPCLMIYNYNEDSEIEETIANAIENFKPIKREELIILEQERKILVPVNKRIRNN